MIITLDCAHEEHRGSDGQQGWVRVAQLYLGPDSFVNGREHERDLFDASLAERPDVPAGAEWLPVVSWLSRDSFLWGTSDPDAVEPEGPAEYSFKFVCPECERAGWDTNVTFSGAVLHRVMWTLAGYRIGATWAQVGEPVTQISIQELGPFVERLRDLAGS